MASSRFIVMACTAHGWLQVSPWFKSALHADEFRDLHLASERSSKIARAGATSTDGDLDISGDVLRVFEVL